jgi:hypothetical protein
MHEDRRDIFQLLGRVDTPNPPGWVVNGHNYKAGEIRTSLGSLKEERTTKDGGPRGDKHRFDHGVHRRKIIPT